MLGEVSRRRVIFHSNIIKFKFSKWLKLQHFPGAQERENKNCGTPLCCSSSNLRSKWKTNSLHTVSLSLFKNITFCGKGKKAKLKTYGNMFFKLGFLLVRYWCWWFHFPSKKKNQLFHLISKNETYERKLRTDRCVQLMLASAIMSEIVIRHMKYSCIRVAFWHILFYLKISGADNSVYMQHILYYIVNFELLSYCCYGSCVNSLASLHSYWTGVNLWYYFSFSMFWLKKNSDLFSCTVNSERMPQAVLWL